MSLWKIEPNKQPYRADPSTTVFLVNTQTGEKIEFRSIEAAEKEMEKLNKGK